MKTSMKYILVLGIIVFLGIVRFNGVDGAGECGTSSPDTEAFKLAPSASATQNENNAVSSNCCLQLKSSFMGLQDNNGYLNNFGIAAVKMRKSELQVGLSY